MSIIDLPVTTEKAEPRQRLVAIRYHLLAHPLGLAGAAIMVVFVFCAVFADFITAYSPTTTDSAMRLLHPEPGTRSARSDGPRYLQPHHLRRAYLARGGPGLDAARLGLWRQPLVLPPAISAALVDLVIHASSTCCKPCRLGAGAGDWRRRSDLRSTTPSSPSPFRSSLYRARHPLQYAGAARAAFVEAARAVGMSEFRIAVRHVLPNTVAPLIVIADGAARRCHSHRGLAVVPRARRAGAAPVLGRMLSESAAEYVRTAPWLVIFSGRRHQPCRVRHQSVRGRAARHPRSAAARLIMVMVAERRQEGAAAAEPLLAGRRSAHLFRSAPRHRQSRRRRQLHARAARDAAIVGESGCGKEHHRAVTDAAGARSARRIASGSVKLAAGTCSRSTTRPCAQCAAKTSP